MHTPKPHKPCPCGSGRPYRDCCGRESRPRDAARASAPGKARPKVPEPTADGPTGEAGDLSEPFDLDDLTATAKSAYVALEPYLPRFEALLADPQAYLQRARTLFGQEEFAPLCFSIEDMREVLGAIGSPPDEGVEDGEVLDILGKAAMDMADRRYRRRAARYLLGLLPKYVAAERHIDAWIIYLSAMQALEVDEHVTPFLQLIFFVSLDRANKAMHGLHAQMLRDLGADPAELKRMSPEELTIRFCERMGAPDGEAWARGFLEGAPVGRVWMESRLAAVQSQAPQLFEREDARHLYLSVSELRPWLRRMEDSLKDLFPIMEKELRGGGPTEKTMRRVTDVVLGVAREAAAKIFVPERIEQVALQLLDYGQRLSEAGEREAAGIARGLALALPMVPNGGSSYALMMLCYYSMRAFG